MLRVLSSAFSENWFVILLLLASSAAGLAIITERFLVLKAASAIDKDELLRFIQAYCMQGQFQKAISAVSQSKGPLPSIVRAGLIAVSNGNGPDEIQTAMDAVALREIPLIQRRVELIAVCANVALLFGLVGAVSGIISAATVVVIADKPRFGTLPEGMSAFSFGICITATLYIGWGITHYWSQKIMDDIHEASVATLNFIIVNKDKIVKF